jgi:hypothetical protein
VSHAGDVHRRLLVLLTSAALLAGCQVGGDDPSAQQPTASPSRTSEPTEPASSSSPAASEPAESAEPTDSAQPTEPTESAEPSASPAPPPAHFRASNAMAVVRWLAGEVGPRESTTARYRRAARGVDRRLTARGYDVTRQPFRAPAGVSWGVSVPAGRTWNVVATPPGYRAGRPHLVVGAHLDTVPQAPGAEDNASGVAVLLELARMAARDGTRLPVVLVAFGAEEPRGEGDANHHFGSRTYVDAMTPAQRRGQQAMVSLDRVGVGSVVPLCTGGISPLTVRAQLVRAAERVDVPVQTCSDNASSDHWQFEQAGEPAARMGSTPYAAYHSEADLPAVVSPAQLRRVGRIAWEWMRARDPGR